MVRVELSNQQQLMPVDEPLVQRSVRRILEDHQVRSGEVSVAIVDDNAIRRLNRQFLQHDEPTDALSFVLEEGSGHLEGQIVVSAETAARTAPQYDWSRANELLLYVVHAALHLVGYRDGQPDEAAVMRERERHYLAQLGCSPPRVGTPT
jgi:probable rRNA maturation factor